MKRRGQLWYVDFIIGVLVIAFIGVLFAKTIIDVPQRETDLQVLGSDALTISNLLMSPALQSSQWVNGQGKIGLVDDGKINRAWLNNFLTLVESENGYDTSRQLFGTNFDYGLYFERKDGTVLNNKVYGGVDSLDQLSNLKAENLLALNRVVYVDDDGDGLGDVAKMVLLVWDYGDEKITHQRICQRIEQEDLCLLIQDLFPGYHRGCQCEWPVSYCGPPNPTC